MARILVLAKSGFGKTTAYSGREKFGVKGLNPKDTYVIQCVNRNVANPNFKLTTYNPKDLTTIVKGNRIQVGGITGIERFQAVASIIEALADSNAPYKNIVVDDFNYLAQDYYMANALKGGWDTPKQIGYGMGLIFNAIDKVGEEKNIICLAHYEEFKDKNGDSISYKFKTTGKMVDDYITPEGKFDIILYGKSGWNEQEKKATKEFVIEFDGEYPAKDSLGIMDSYPIYIPNDLSIVVDAVDKHYGR